MRLGIDTGGTYTDAVLYDSAYGVVRTAKSLTTHHELSLGIRDVIDQIDADGTAFSELVEFTSISTTLATNSIVEKRGGTICLLLIGHKPESLNRSDLGKALRNDPVIFIQGGHTAQGDEAHTLDLETARSAILRHGDEVTAFAVAGMFSVRNTAHEIAVRNLVLELSDRPVTCSFELTAQLDAPRRAMTAVLNARLIAPITELIETVRAELVSRSVASPLMVVKGDGSLISADIASARPVETILSGPAASIIGASRLSSKPISIVADIGGTTTDIAILRNGKPRIARHGAFVGGFRTFVEAAHVYTIGLGGDSQVSCDMPLEVGPTRSLPLCVIGRQHPEVIDLLSQQLKRRPQEHQGSFALRRRTTADVNNLGKGDRQLWDILADGPIESEELFRDPRLLKAFQRLRTLDLVALASFTPTDALHVLGEMDRWCTQSAILAAQLWTRGFERRANPRWASCQQFCRDVIEKVIQRSCEALVISAASAESIEDDLPNLGEILLNSGISGHKSDLLEVQFSLKGTLAAVGAPAKLFYPQVASRLNTRLEIPKHAEVGNAIGAVAGEVSQRISGLITSPGEGVYRAHVPSGIYDMDNLEKAVAIVSDELEIIARQRAVDAKAQNPQVSTDRKDIVVRGLGDMSIFVESRITVTVSGEVGLKDQDESVRISRSNA